LKATEAAIPLRGLRKSTHFLCGAGRTNPTHRHFDLQKRAKGALQCATALRPTREKSLSAEFFL
jgi:hypothetical protein